MKSHKSDWERVNPEKLGEGGQSEVYLVRTPERSKQRARSLQSLESYSPPSMIVTTVEKRASMTIEFSDAIRNYIRDDKPNELGAMKEFTLRDDEEQSLRRLQQEIDVLNENRPGLPKLLGSNIDERWMVTEFFSNGTLGIAAIFSDSCSNAAQFLCDPDCMAERDGFEPTVRF